MAVVSWHPEIMQRSLVMAFKPAALGVQQVARARAPRVTGELASSILVAFLSEKNALMRSTGTDYAGAVISGARPHPIVAPPGKALPTPYGYFASVDHPGNAPNTFMQQAGAALAGLYTKFARATFRT